MLPNLDGLREKLDAGARAADLGCGDGTVLRMMAKALPNAEWHGYDISKRLLAYAIADTEKEGLTNVSFHHLGEEQFPSDGSLQLVMLADVIHDLSSPEEVLTAVRKSLRPDGVAVAVEPIAPDSVAERLARPNAGFFYMLSMAACLSSSTSEEGGAGIGFFGLTDQLLRDLANRAGFTQVRDLSITDGSAMEYHELRP